MVLPRQDLAPTRLFAGVRGCAEPDSGRAAPASSSPSVRCCMRRCSWSRAVSTRRSRGSRRGSGRATNGSATRSYNIGVALVRLSRVADGARVLAEVGQMEPTNAELARCATRPTSRSAMRGCRPVSRPRPSRRCSGSGSRGHIRTRRCSAWAGRSAEQGNYRRRSRRGSSCGVAICWTRPCRNRCWPCPMHSLSSAPSKQAADYYVEAIAAFNAEIGRHRRDDRRDPRTVALIERAAGARAKRFSHAAQTGSGWYLAPRRDSRHRPRAAISTSSWPRTRFRKGSRTIAICIYLQPNLDRGTIEPRRLRRHTRYETARLRERLPVIIETNLDRIDLDALAQRRVDARVAAPDDRASRGRRGARNGRAAGLWRELGAMEPQARPLAERRARPSELRVQAAISQGLLFWDLKRDYNARLWQERESLRDLDLQLKEARRRHYEVEAARDEWPDEFAALTERIDALKPACRGSRGTAAVAAVTRQKDYRPRHRHRGAAGAARSRLDTYALQARFALASIYDRAAAQNTGAKPPSESPAPSAVDPAAATGWSPPTADPVLRRTADERGRADHHRDVGALAVRHRHKDDAGTIKSTRRRRVVAVDTEREDRRQRGQGDAIATGRSRAGVCDPLLRAEAMRRLADLELETRGGRGARSRTSDSLGGISGEHRSVRQLLESYPNYSKNDLVLYQLARAYEAAGDNDARARDAWTGSSGSIRARLTASEAEFRRGETLFVAKRYADAEEAYRKMLEDRPRLAVLRASAL